MALKLGADDLHGTIIEEHIFRMAGGQASQLQAGADLVKAIRETGHPIRLHNLFPDGIS